MALSNYPYIMFQIIRVPIKMSSRDSSISELISIHLHLRLIGHRDHKHTINCQTSQMGKWSFDRKSWFKIIRTLNLLQINMAIIKITNIRNILNNLQSPKLNIIWLLRTAIIISYTNQSFFQTTFTSKKLFKQFHSNKFSQIYKIRETNHLLI